MWYNPIMIWLLRSPLHGILSGSMVVLKYAGRKSGRTYQTPVNYLQNGDLLYTTSFRRRTWWRNLRGGAPVTVCLHGKDLPAVSTVLETEADVSQALAEIVRLNPPYARWLEVKLDDRGRPDPVSLRAAAETRVVIQTRLTTTTQ